MQSDNDDLRAILQHAQQDLSAIPVEVAATPEKGWWEGFKDYLMDRFLPEIGDMLMQKTAQGATEISQALYHGQGFTPYGHAQSPLEVEGPMQSYETMLREASQRASPEQDRGMERG